jgi:hypothetical protein
MGAALSFGAAACPKAGVATAAATANTTGKFRHCEFIALLLLFRCVPLEVSMSMLHLLNADVKLVPLHNCKAETC